MILKRRLKLCLLLALALFAAGTMIAEGAFAADWFNEDWHYRREITIDHNQVQDVADPSAEYAGFPLLVFATGLSDINANGTDVRFTASDGTTELPREIESYAGGTLYAWVKVTLTKDSSDSTDDVIYMYYGNPAATEPAPSGSNGSENVWDSSYKAVWHLREEQTGTGNLALYQDSTANNNDGDDYVSNTSQTGQIGNSQKFNGSSDYIDVGSPNFGISGFTYCVWIYPEAITGNHVILHYNNVADNDSLGLRLSASGILDVFDGNIDLGWTVTPLAINNWYHICFTSDSLTDDVTANDTTNAYINGALNNSEVRNYNPWFASDKFYISNPIWGNIKFNGKIDEVRVSNAVRTADWIETSYNNQNNPSSFLTVSEQVTIPTMTEWGMIVFAVLAGLSAVYYLSGRPLH